MQRMSVDLPDPDGPADHDPLAAADRQIDVAQHVELPVPLVDARELDDGIGGLHGAPLWLA